MTWLNMIPLAGIGLFVLFLLFACVELGFRLRRRLPASDAAGAGQDHMLSAVLGLLALLLGFTFSLALNRYELRRDLVVQEANAIGTTWLRAQLLEEPNRSAMTVLLRDYGDARLAWSEAHADLARTNAMQQKLWVVTGAAVRSDSSTQLTRGLMDAMNESFDLASARAAARSAHIPDRVLQVLVLYAALSMVMLGYTLGAGERLPRITTGVVLLLLTLAVVVILDLDRPTSGAIQVSQQPLEALRQSMR